MKKQFINTLFLLIILAGGISGCSCNPEKVIRWVFQFSNSLQAIEETRAIGQFGRVEANLKKELGEEASTIELKLYNGQLPELYENEANIARQCAKAFVMAFESEDYDEIIVFIIKTNENQHEQILYKSQYRFEMPSLTRE